MTNVKNVIMVGIVATGLVGCGSSASETPPQALQAIIRLYEARDFDALIRTRYAELFKAEDESQIQELVNRFADLFQDADNLNEAISTYQSALGVTPAITDDSVAVYDLNGRSFRMSRMQDGRWGFHL